jgi:uroporphyrin-III C-methyltransferase
VSESFWVITGTTSARKLSTDVALAAQSSATVVVLMGMSKLNEIVAIFQKRPKERHRCDYSKRNYSEEKNGIGTINSIEQVVFEQN